MKKKKEKKNGGMKKRKKERKKEKRRKKAWKLYGEISRTNLSLSWTENAIIFSFAKFSDLFGVKRRVRVLTFG